MKKILLLVPPFFTPFAPPLGVSLLKSYLHDHYVKCMDLNTNADLWDMHHNYFDILKKVTGNQLDGYSLYWYILNPHMLAYANGATNEECSYVLKVLCDKYSLKIDDSIVNALNRVVSKYFTMLEKIILHDIQIDQYDYLGTSTYSTSLASSVFIHKIVKQNYPNIITLMGGGVFADDLGIGTENLQTLVNEYSFIDKIVIGEGELLFRKILQGQFKDQRIISLSDIANETLDINESLIPDFSDFDLDEYHHVTIEGSRSCPFQCQFCSERIQWGPYRKKNPEYLGEQLLSLSSTYGRKTFFLGDSLINLYVKELSEYLVKKDAQIYFDGYLRAEEPVTIRENTRLWARAGLYRVRLGMESASARVLKLMKKKITPENMRESLKSLSSAGIRSTTYWVVGFPGETEEDFQATLEFIKENYRHIYELEAHPYYYYPTSQGVSSEYESQSLYPKEVSDIVKFKKYDIINPVPSREERFNRLRRISELSSDLGLINIYTLQDIFRAEERWLSLYPLAREIYPGTKFTRNSLQRTRYDIAFSPVQKHLLQRGRLHDCVVYQVAIQEELHQDILKEAIFELLQYHELLNVSFVQNQGQFEQKFNPEMGNIEFCILCLDDDRGKQIDTTVNSFIEKMVSEIFPDQAPLLKVGIIKSSQKKYRLVFVGSRLICDPESLVIVAEDVHRIYQQKLNNLPLSLEPIQTLYSDLHKNHLCDKSVQALELERVETKNKAISLDLGSASIPWLKDSEILKECIAATVMQSLCEITGKRSLTIDIATSYRYKKDELKNLFGPLQRIIGFEYEYASQEDPMKTLKYMKGFLQKRLTSQLDVSTNNQILLNLEYISSSPWLGGDSWQSKGFSLHSTAITRDYGIEMIPRVTDNLLTLDLLYCCESEIVEIADKLSYKLKEKFIEKVNDLRAYSSSKQFWLTQFKDYVPRVVSKIKTGKASLNSKLMLQTEDLNEVNSNLTKIAEDYHCNLEVVYFSAFSIVFSRYFHFDDYAMYLVDQDELFPIRIKINEESRFDKYVAEITQLLCDSKKHKYSIAILDEYFANQPVTTIGCILVNDNRLLNEAEEKLISNQINLILQVDSGVIQIKYGEETFTDKEICTMLCYFENFLTNISQSDNLKIGEIDIAYKVCKQEESLDISFDF